MAQSLASLLASFPVFRQLARVAWCAEQRSSLRKVAQVVWVRDREKMPWVIWGADHGYFDLEYAGELPYLRLAVAAG